MIAEASAAVAQVSARPDRLSPNGPQIEAYLEGTDPLEDSGHYHDYKITLAKGQTVLVKMESGMVDAHLAVFRAGTTVPLAQNDDYRAGSLDAELRFTAPEASDYVIRAKAADDGGEGGYLIEVTGLSLRPEQAIMLRSGDTRPGKISREDPYLDGAVPYDLYNFIGEEGQRVQIDMVASGDRPEGFDPHLRLLGPSGSDVHVEDDDGGGERNARLFAILPKAGRYAIQAQSQSGSTGSYEIRLTQVAKPAGSAAREVEGGILEDGSSDHSFALTDADLGFQMAGGAGVDYFYKSFQLPIRAGEPVAVSLTAEDPARLDLMLVAGVPSPIGFAQARMNDDASRTDPNPRLFLTPTQSGTLVIRAVTIGRGLGRFTAKVDRGAAATARAPARSM